MAYRFARKFDPAHEVRRVLLEQNRKAQALLDDWQRDPADHIHRARQSFKRIRALLRLLRRSNPYVYQVENRSYRDLAARLAYARDASAMVEAADALAQRIWEPGPRDSLLMLRRSLATQAEREMALALTGMGDTVRSAREELAVLADRLADLPLRGLSRKKLRRGARATLARARRDYEGLDLHSPAERFHDWRKFLKYAYYQTALMSELMPKWSARRCRDLGELAALLGDAQDLAVLGQCLSRQPDELGIDIAWRRLRKHVSAVQREMHLQAIARGRQLFDRPRGAAGAEIVPLQVETRRA